MTGALICLELIETQSKQSKETKGAEAAAAKTPASFLKRAVMAAPAAGLLIATGGIDDLDLNFNSGGFVGSFLAACGWALMLAAGAVVYQHFLGKWQNSGLTMAPIQAMGTPPYMQPPNMQNQPHPQSHHPGHQGRSYSHPPAANHGHSLPNQGHPQGPRGPSSRYDC
jgi:hypothetical protein